MTYTRQSIDLITVNPPLDGGWSRAVLGDQLSVIKCLEAFVESQLTLLKPVEESWQPSDELPDCTAATWREDIQLLRKRAKGLSDELLVVMIGDMITEEALPSYQAMINRHHGLTDATGASDTPWARWIRGWTAEENRHGTLLNMYLYLTGRVNMRAVEMTTQHLLRNGFDPQTNNDPYQGLIYTAFQERATKYSHHNAAQLAIQEGEPVLAKFCTLIAGDEARHEEAYKRFVGEIVTLDPSGAVMAFARMMKTRIVMPGLRMFDGKSSDLFERFSVVAQRIGVYTARDYANIIKHLVEYWKISLLTGLSSQAQAAQDYVCGLAEHYLKFAAKMESRLATQPKVPLSWIFDRPV